MSIQFAVMGTGYFGKNYVRDLGDMDGTELNGTANNASEADELIKKQDIDAVVIATPGAVHFEQAKTAIEAGKHVLVEKPMTMTLAEAQELAEVVRGSDRVFMVGHQYLYNDHIHHIKKLIDDGDLGKVHYIYSEHFYQGALRHDMGVFLDASPHTWALLDYWFGELRIKNSQGSKVVFPGSQHDDFVSVNTKFDSGLLSTFSASRFAPAKSRRIFIGGDKAQVLYDEYGSDKLKVIRHPYPGEKGFAGKSSDFFRVEESEIEIPDIKASQPLKNQLTHFIDCIQQNKTPVTDIEHGLRVANLIDEIGKSII